MYNKAEELKKSIMVKYKMVTKIKITECEEGIYLEIDFKNKSRREGVNILLKEGTMQIMSFCKSSYSYSELDEAMNIVNSSLQFIKLYRKYEFVFAEMSGIYTDSAFVENAMLLYGRFLKDLRKAQKILEGI